MILIKKWYAYLYENLILDLDSLLNLEKEVIFNLELPICIKNHILILKKNQRNKDFNLSLDINKIVIELSKKPNEFFTQYLQFCHNVPPELNEDLNYINKKINYLANLLNLFKYFPRFDNEMVLKCAYSNVFFKDNNLSISDDLNIISKIIKNFLIEFSAKRDKGCFTTGKIQLSIGDKFLKETIKIIENEILIQISQIYQGKKFIAYFKENEKSKWKHVEIIIFKEKMILTEIKIRGDLIKTNISTPTYILNLGKINSLEFIGSDDNRFHEFFNKDTNKDFLQIQLENNNIYFSEKLKKLKKISSYIEIILDYKKNYSIKNKKN